MITILPGDGGTKRLNESRSRGSRKTTRRQEIYVNRTLLLRVGGRFQSVENCYRASLGEGVAGPIEKKEIN